MRKSLLLTFLVFLLFGCATSDFTQTGQTYPKYKGPVKIYFDVPNADFEQIGIVSSQGGNIHERTDLLEAMQEEAAKHGANAIVILSEKTRSSFSLSSNEFGTYAGTSAQKSSSAVAVRVRSR